MTRPTLLSSSRACCADLTMNKHKAILPFLVLAAIATLLWVLERFAQRDFGGFTIYLRSATVYVGVFMVARWLAILAFVYYTVAKRSLAVWIVAGMLFGIEAGHDFSPAAADLQGLGAVFFALGKGIIWPLIFRTLG